MPATWFTGDPHFGHVKVAEIRGFDNLADHDLSIVRRWERQVGLSDTVYVLGDISGGSGTGERHALEILAQLPGKKHLIAGNHDSVSPIHRNAHKSLSGFLGVFDSVQHFARIRAEGQNVLLSHYPYTASGDGPGRGPIRYEQYRLPDLGLPLVHAHTHHTDPYDGSSTGRELCVSWDAWRRMVNLGDVTNWLKTLAPAPTSV